MPEKAASTLPGNARPLVHSDRGCHCRWPGWLGLMERFGLTRSMSAKGCSPDNAAAEGFFGRMKTEAVYPEKWEEHTRNEVLALVDEYIRWHDHERIKQSLGVLLQCLFDRFGSVFPQCGLMVFPGVVIVSR